MRTEFPGDRPIDLLTILLDLEGATGPDFQVIQIGANDGVSGDPIHDHVTSRGWSLLAVEPLSGPFAKLVQTYSNLNNVKCENCAISTDANPKILYSVHGDNGLEQLSSFSKEVIMKHRHSFPNLKDRIREIEVPCMTFRQLLEKHHLEFADLLWIDTEGFEYQVIKMCMEANLCPTIIGFESVHLHHSEKRLCAQLLASKGYRWLSFGRDTIAYRGPGKSAKSSQI